MEGRAEEAEKHGRNRGGRVTWEEQRRQSNMEGRADEAEKHGR